MRSDFKVWIRF